MSVVPSSIRAVGDLYILPVSPWSKRILLAQYHLRSQVVIKKYQPPLSELFIRIRAGWPKRTITAPALFTPSGTLICESHDIARILDSARAPNTTTLFPPEHDEQLRELVKAAEDVSVYARAVGLRSFVENPAQAAKILFPKFLSIIPGISFFARIIANSVKKKYDPVSATSSDEKTRKCLDIIRNAIQSGNGEFLLGDTLTYADIAVSGALATLISEDETNALGTSQFPELAQEYDDVKKWGDAFLAKYVTSETVGFPPKKYDVNGNVIR